MINDTNIGGDVQVDAAGAQRAYFREISLTSGAHEQAGDETLPDAISDLVSSLGVSPGAAPEASTVQEPYGKWFRSAPEPDPC